jgi:general secretion pathway protein H
MKRADGFTLLEMLVVLAVLALVSAITIPALTKRQMSETERTADIIQSALIAAREKSIAANREVRVDFDLSTRTLSTDGATQKLSDDVQIRITSEATRVAQSARIRFFPDGGSSGGRIVVDDAIAIDVNWVTATVSQGAP